MSNKEKRAVYALSFLIVISGAYLIGKYYWDHTKEVPTAGGSYAEAMVGQVNYINPALCQTNDVDADLSSLIFSSLLRTDSNGKLQNDLAESYEVSDDKLTYTFHIKKNVKWQDDKNLTVDDVIYTIKTIQDDSYHSPLIANWKGIRTEKVDDYTMKFILKNAYTPFPNNLTFGILPQHLWEQISANQFPLSEFNYKPIGSGAYKFDSFKKDRNGKIISLVVAANSDYYNGAPKIKKITFKFYSSESDAITAFNRKEVKGIDFLSPENMGKIADIKDKNVYRLQMPRYYGVFFNQIQSKPLADKNVRLALAYAVDKNKLIQEVLKGEGQVVDSPIPEGLLGYNPSVKTYGYSLDTANNLLAQAGWVDNDKDGIREKGSDKLEFTLISSNLPDTAKTAGVLQAMWKEVGVNVKVETSNDIDNNNIQDRSYEAVLFGEILNFNPDPFAFWHSSQKKDPGLNLALYDNSDVDKLLEEARQESNPDIRAQKYQQFQNLVIEDEPAVFLYRPNYIYIQDKSVKGMDTKNITTPSDRFNNVQNWYMKTKRIPK